MAASFNFCSAEILVWCLAVSMTSPTGVFASQLVWERDPAFDDVLPKCMHDDTSGVPVRSLLDCGQRCTRQRHCNAFFYNYVTKDCLRKRMVYKKPGKFKSKPGWRYYRLSSDGPGSSHHRYLFSDRVTGFGFYLEPVTLGPLGPGAVGDLTTCRLKCGQQAGGGGDVALLKPPGKARFTTRFFLANPGLNIDQDIFASTGCSGGSGSVGGILPAMSQSDCLSKLEHTLGISSKDDFLFPGQPPPPPLGQLVRTATGVVGVWVGVSQKAHNFKWKLVPLLVSTKKRGYILCEVAL